MVLNLVKYREYYETQIHLRVALGSSFLFSGGYNDKNNFTSITNCARQLSFLGKEQAAYFSDIVFKFFYNLLQKIAIIDDTQE